MLDSNNELERAKGLLMETAEIMAKFRQDSEKIIGHVESKLDKSLGEQRKMIVEMVRQEVTRETSVAVSRYVADMEDARNQMAEQVREFNTYLQQVNEENKKISSRNVLTVSIVLAVMVIGAVALFFFFYHVLVRQKVDADMVHKINRADIVNCGDDLCAKTGKASANGYRVIQRR